MANCTEYFKTGKYIVCEHWDTKILMFFEKIEKGGVEIGAKIKSRTHS